jgi:hypothetical protein
VDTISAINAEIRLLVIADYPWLMNAHGGISDGIPNQL